MLQLTDVFCPIIDRLRSSRADHENLTALCRSLPLTRIALLYSYRTCPQSSHQSDAQAIRTLLLIKAIG